MGAPTNEVVDGTAVPPPESVATVIYRHDCPNITPHGQQCPPKWSKFDSLADEGAHLMAEIENDPIIHRRAFNKVTKKWTTVSFSILDPLMREHLRVGLANYQHFDPELHDWTFAAPYSPIVHRWDKLNQLREEATEPGSQRAMEQLMAFLRPILAPSIDSLIETRKTGKVEFENIWQIFPPGELAVTSFFGAEAVARILRYKRVHTPRTQPFWKVTYEYVDWNGERCGYLSSESRINFFKGFKFVTSLAVYPLSFSPAASETKERLTARGRKFESLRGYHFRSCTGTKILLETRMPEERPVSGRVIIDAFAFYSTTNNLNPVMRAMDVDSKQQVEEQSDSVVETEEEDSDEDSVSDTCSSGSGSGSDSDSGSGSDSDIRRHNRRVTRRRVAHGMKAVKPSSTGLKRVEHLQPLTDEQCLLATPWLKGLDLKSKDWARFNVDDISEITWNDEAFKHLVLPGNEKDLAWAFVENKCLSDNQFDDFVPDKGRGIIILMFGPPGVGKTYTAEAVAERSRVPLYNLSAGMLGTRARDVEAALDRALGRCRLWNAMLLLDEADVFLGARTDADLARSELVAVFLTKLEYYQGICFLTANRVASLDHALRSRVDLFLPYSDLLPEARRQVWDGFVRRAGGPDRFDVDDGGLDELAGIPLNGREIKNLVKSAHLLSLKGGERITKDRLKMLAENRIHALSLL